MRTVFALGLLLSLAAQAEPSCADAGPAVALDAGVAGCAVSAVTPPGAWADAGVRHARTVESVRLLYFHASWCPSCKRFDASGALEEVRTRFPSLKVEFIDADTGASELERYGITNIPALVLVDASGFPLGRPRLELDDAPRSVEAVERLVRKMTRGRALTRPERGWRRTTPAPARADPRGRP